MAAHPVMMDMGQRGNTNSVTHIHTSFVLDANFEKAL